jgi:hypothetical protein
MILNHSHKGLFNPKKSDREMLKMAIDNKVFDEINSQARKRGCVVLAIKDDLLGQDNIKQVVLQDMSKEEFIYTLYNATEQAFFGGKYYNYHYNYDVSEAHKLAFKNFRGVMNDE